MFLLNGRVETWLRETERFRVAHNFTVQLLFSRIRSRKRTEEEAQDRNDTLLPDTAALESALPLLLALSLLSVSFMFYFIRPLLCFDILLLLLLLPLLPFLFEIVNTNVLLLLFN